jgi:Asp-tRNA(Asn)/Glu-tRNA(Gln) amidotransferase A subunit family amidase
MFINPASSLPTGQKDITAYINEACDRVDTVDPHIEALIPEPGRRERLIEDADKLQQQFPNPSDRPALYGALVAVKDIFHVSGFVTRAGSKVPPELFAGAEAACVTRLRGAGALILGKSVTTEFAYFEPGPTRNPHNRTHTPGGSSSGSAASVAAGFCTLALGTQTVGSVIRPAAFCGVVGFKPTLHRIPSAGLVHFSRSVDHVGLFTQDVAGMSLAASVLCQAWRPVPQPDALPVLGVPDGAYLDQTEPEALALFEGHLDGLKEAGCRIKRIPVFQDIEAINGLHVNMVSSEFVREHSEIHAKWRHLWRPGTAQMAEAGTRVTDEELHRARRHCGEVRSEIEQLMDREGIDLWVCPAATGPAPEGIHATGNPNMNLPWTHTGMPAITLPVGKAGNGLPLGLQLAASFGADEYLLAWSQMLTDRIGE